MEIPSTPAGLHPSLGEHSPLLRCMVNFQCLQPSDAARMVRAMEQIDEQLTGFIDTRQAFDQGSWGQQRRLAMFLFDGAGGISGFPVTPPPRALVTAAAAEGSDAGEEMSDPPLLSHVDFFCCLFLICTLTNRERVSQLHAPTNQLTGANYACQLCVPTVRATAAPGLALCVGETPEHH